MYKLLAIQTLLKAPKNQYNSFGKYNYRSCEDILEALKPILDLNDCTLVITDEVKSIGNITYIEAACILTDNETKEQVKVTAQAGIDINRKGMDVAQCFGASSSYARKYALNGLFLIDDTKDPDATNTHEDKIPSSNWSKKEEDTKAWLNKGEPLEKAKEFLSNGGTIQQIESKYKLSSEIRNILDAHILTFKNK